MRNERVGIALVPDGADDQSGVIAFLSSHSAYPAHPPAVERLETHGAFVFLAGAEAYKIKRAVRFSYMDFSIRDKRRRAIERELAINQPHAPGIYLGVLAITRDADGQLALGGDGEPVEWALRMRRFDQADLLSARADRSILEVSLCRKLADAAYAFHRSAPVSMTTDSSEQMRAVAHDIAEALAISSPAVLPAAVERFRRDAEGLAARLRPLLERRARAGFVRRCHGDLHLGNIVMWQGDPVLFDAIEFDERLATIDTLYDLAFLIMDLDHRGQRGGANTVLNRYLWRCGSLLDLEGLAALPLFLALRAGVRAMVTAQRAQQEKGSRKDTLLALARGYLESGLAHLEPERPRAVAIGGLSGTGKSTLAAALAPAIGIAPGAVHLRSDLERKALAGVEETVRLPASAYTPESTTEVYRRMLEKAEIVLRAGHSVVVDAVFAKPNERAAVAAAAYRSNAPFTGLWLEAPAPALHARVDARQGDASDATPDVVSKQLSYDLGTVEWITIDAGGSPQSTLAQAQSPLTQVRSVS